MYDFENFTMSVMIDIGAGLRRADERAKSMEEVAENAVNLLRNAFTDPETGESGCALVRLYKTHALGKLEPRTRKFASDLLSSEDLNDSVRCLTLLATCGDKPEWNDRYLSNGHLSIPLPSKDVVNSIPMVSQLLLQLGISVEHVIAPDPNLVIELSERSYGVFHVEDAVGSPYVPAQDFVVAHNIRSALGFGGILPSGDVFAVILFSHPPISRVVADRFRSLALQLKVALLSFSDEQTFKAT